MPSYYPDFGQPQLHKPDSLPESVRSDGSRHLMLVGSCIDMTTHFVFKKTDARLPHTVDSLIKGAANVQRALRALSPVADRNYCR